MQVETYQESDTESIPLLGDSKTDGKVSRCGVTYILFGILSACCLGFGFYVIETAPRFGIRAAAISYFGSFAYHILVAPVLWFVTKCFEKRSICHQTTKFKEVFDKNPF